MDWEQAALTLVAVIIGAGASTAGTVIARRIDIRHTRRVDLRQACAAARRALGPTFGTKDDRLPKSTLDLVGEVTRLGVIVGPREYELTLEVIKPLIQIELVQRTIPKAPVALHIELRTALDNLQSHLTIKLAPRRRRPKRS